MKLLYALCDLLLASTAWAMPDMLMDGVKMPVWVERGARHFPLSPGPALNSGDTLLTGQGARLQVSRLAQQRDGQSLSAPHWMWRRVLSVLPPRHWPKCARAMLR